MRTFGLPARLRRTIPVLALGVAALAGCGAPQVVAGRATPAAAVPASPSGGASAAAQPTCEVRVPNLVGMTGDEASAALNVTAALDIRFAVNFAPMTNKVISQSPTPGTCQRATDAIDLTLEPPPPAPHRQVSARDWQMIAKSPDSHTRERITLYGYVFQFDSATARTDSSPVSTG